MPYKKQNPRSFGMRMLQSYSCDDFRRCLGDSFTAVIIKDNEFAVHPTEDSLSFLKQDNSGFIQVGGSGRNLAGYRFKANVKYQFTVGVYYRMNIKVSHN